MPELAPVTRQIFPFIELVVGGICFSPINCILGWAASSGMKSDGMLPCFQASLSKRRSGINQIAATKTYKPNETIGNLSDPSMANK